MEGRTETVILEDTTEEKQSSSYPYFKFFLVKEQKEIFICTRCSICMSTEERIKVIDTAFKIDPNDIRYQAVQNSERRNVPKNGGGEPKL